MLSRTPEISEKEIEDKIRATMAKIQAQTAKSDRSKFRRGKREAVQEKMAAEQEGMSNTKLQVAEFTTVSELASLMNIAPVQIIQTCMQLGVIVSINQRLDATIIELVAAENGFEVEFISAADQTAFVEESPDSPEELQPRAPISNHHAATVTTTGKHLCLIISAKPMLPPKKPVVLPNTSVLTRLQLQAGEKLLSSIRRVTKHSPLCVLGVQK